MNMLTYAIYKRTPALDRPAFARAKGQGVLEDFDTVKQSLNGQHVILKWRGQQPAELAPGLIIWQGNHAEILQKLTDDIAEWDDLS